MHLLNDWSYGGWAIFGEAWLALGQMMWLASGAWRQSGTCVVPDNPSPTKEEDQTELAPELAGRKLGDRGRGGHHYCTEGPPSHNRPGD